jgi:hypothetical protein
MSRAKSHDTYLVQCMLCGRSFNLRLGHQLARKFVSMHVCLDYAGYLFLWHHTGYVYLLFTRRGQMLRSKLQCVCSFTNKGQGVIEEADMKAAFNGEYDITSRLLRAEADRDGRMSRQEFEAVARCQQQRCCRALRGPDRGPCGEGALRRRGGAQPAASRLQGRCRPDSADWLQLLCIGDSTTYSSVVLTGHCATECMKQCANAAQLLAPSFRPAAGLATPAIAAPTACWLHVMLAAHSIYRNWGREPVEQQSAGCTDLMPGDRPLGAGFSVCGGAHAAQLGQAGSTDVSAEYGLHLQFYGHHHVTFRCR